MIVYTYEPELWVRAQARATSMPIYAGSHRGKAANEVGALGEVLFEHFLEERGIPFTPRYVTTDDLVLFGAPADVKTKDRTVRPLPHHDCSVPLYNHEHQRPSFYVFVSLLRDSRSDRTGLDRFTHAYILGWATLKQVDQGRRWEAGQVDEANGTRFWTACLNVPIASLNSMELMVSRCRERMRS